MSKLTVRGFVKKYPDLYSESAWRQLIFKKNKNGLLDYEVILKIGNGKIFIDEDNFHKWFNSHYISNDKN